MNKQQTKTYNNQTQIKINIFINKYIQQLIMCAVFSTTNERECAYIYEVPVYWKYDLLYF